MALLAPHAELTAVAAALLTTAYREVFTAPARRPVLALALGVAALAFIAYSAVTQGPAETTTPLVLRLPAVLFDRARGLVATAPWLLIGLAGLVTALRTSPRTHAPAAIAVGLGLIAAAGTALDRSTAIPAYATVATMALWSPFVATGLASLRSTAGAILAAVLIVPSAVAAFAAASFPPLALASAGDGRMRQLVDHLLGIDPLAWLPDLGADPSARDLISLLAAAAIATGLVIAGAYARRPVIDGVLVHPLRKITDARGAIMHMLRRDDPHFERFGEIYFSVVNPGVVKGWHLHSRMTLNYAVPQGRIRLVLYDPRDSSPTRGQVQEIALGGDDYALVRVPAGVWNAFLGLGSDPAIVANCATEPHDPGEIVRKPPRASDIPYEWGDISPVSG